MQEKIDEFAEWLLTLNSTDQSEGRKAIQELQKKWAEAEKQFDEVFAETKKMAEADSANGGLVDERTMLNAMGCFTGFEEASKGWVEYFGGNA